MAVHDIIPSSNVLASDIRDTLNANGSSCTNEIITFFNSKAVINHWSFRKPYSSDDDMFMLTDAQIMSINCGFTPKQIASYTSLADPTIMDGDMNGWVYNRPFGGATSPYRLGDYIGYYPKARPMIENFFVPEQASNQFSGTYVGATAIVASEHDGKSVTLADLGTLSSYYPAVYVKQASGSQSRMYEGESTIGSSGTFNVEIPVSDLSITGNWVVYPFLKKGSTYYTIPNVSARTINIVATYFSLAVRVERRTDGTKTIDYTITVVNNTSAQTWTNNTWRLRYFNKKFSDVMVDGEMSGNLTSPQTIKANGTTTITGSISNINAKMWEQPVMTLWVSFNSGNQVQSGVAVEINKE